MIFLEDFHKSESANPEYWITALPSETFLNYHCNGWITLSLPSPSRGRVRVGVSTYIACNVILEYFVRYGLKKRSWPALKKTAMVPIKVWPLWSGSLRN